jgi:superfamily II DNA helicase RecQ
MSERKLQEFGRVVLAVVAGHLETQPRQIFAATSFEERAAEPGERRRSAADDDRPYDKELFERLRGVRWKLADGRGLPAYLILHDSALRGMARDYPINERELARVSGVGEKRVRDFGATFLAEITAYLDSHPRQAFAVDSVATPPRLPQPVATPNPDLPHAERAGAQDGSRKLR